MSVLPSERHSPIGAEVNSDEVTHEDEVEVDMSQTTAKNDEAWDCWEDAETTVKSLDKTPSEVEVEKKADLSEKIAAARKEKSKIVDLDMDSLDIKVSKQTKVENEEDFFADMQPVIKKKDVEEKDTKGQIEGDDNKELPPTSKFAAAEVDLEAADGWGSDGDWGE